MSGWERLLTTRCSIWLLSMFTLIAICMSAVRSQSCKNATKNVVFLGLVPTCSQSQLNVSRSAEENLEKCDVLAQTAVQLAVERINQSPDILRSNTTLHVVQLLSESDSSEDTELQTVTGAFRDEEYFGVIGPNSTIVAEFWTPIFHKLNLTTVSHTVTGTALNEAHSFYRTLPSSQSANIGRLVLIARNKWFRIASINSNETYYAKEAEDFVQRFSERLSSNIDSELGLTVSFSDSPYSAIHDIKRIDINIIMGFFGPGNARKILCIANSVGLVSGDHAWVLPSYYNPNWWNQSQTSSGAASNCSDDQMREILESVIFVDTVKFPSVDESLNEFHEELLVKALDLFPSLTEEDLKPYLLRSRATNAYDAVSLLARSVGVAFEESEGNCIDTNLVQVALKGMFMQCEYCRLYSGCFLNYDTNISSQCVELCDPNFTPKLKFNIEELANLRTDYRYLLNSFGQIFYSQFIDGIECPIGLLWASSSGNSSQISSERIYTLEELDEASCAVRLNLSKELFIRKGCPLTFQWRGSSQPPSSRYLMIISFSLATVIIIGLLTGLGLAMAVALIVFNIVWRSNKVVRASSPWLNVILLLGIITRLPSALLSSLVVSSIKYEIDVNDHTCHFQTWLYHLGEVVFLATLIVKNWRIYRIFNNKSLKIIGDKLSDHHLMVVILLLLLPIIITLIVWSSFGIHLETDLSHNENLQLVQLAFCTSRSYVYFTIVTIVYAVILLLILFILTFLTLRSTMSAFRREGVLSYIATTITLFPIPVFTVILGLASVNGIFEEDTMHMIFVGVEFTLGVLLPILIMLVLFLPNVYQVLLKERLKKRFGVKTKEVESLVSQDLSSRYHSLRQQSASLKLQLSEVNHLIAELLEQKPTEQTHSVNHTSPLTTGSTQSESQTKNQEAIQTTICEKTTEFSTHQNHGEHTRLDLTSLAIPAETATSDYSAARDSLEQCNEIDARLCVTVSSSCPSPHNLQENEHNNNMRTLQEPDKESTGDDSNIDC